MVEKVNNELISSYEFQNDYVNLYKTLREYILDFKTVCAIADLEISCYESCPNVQNIKLRLQDLKREVSKTLQDDEEMQEAFEQFEDLLEESNDTYYCPLGSVTVNLDNVVDVEEDDYEDYEEDNGDFEDYEDYGEESDRI